MSIGILVYQNDEKKVIVSFVKSGTLAHEKIMPDDIVTMVNGKPCADKSKAKKSIFASVKKDNSVTLTLDP